MEFYWVLCALQYISAKNVLALVVLPNQKNVHVRITRAILEQAQPHNLSECSGCGHCSAFLASFPHWIIQEQAVLDPTDVQVCRANGSIGSWWGLPLGTPPHSFMALLSDLTFDKCSQWIQITNPVTVHCPHSHQSGCGHWFEIDLIHSMEEVYKTSTVHVRTVVLSMAANKITIIFLKIKLKNESRGWISCFCHPLILFALVFKNLFLVVLVKLM